MGMSFLLRVEAVVVLFTRGDAKGYGTGTPLVQTPTGFFSMSIFSWEKYFLLSPV
jgi:hypothetical protein